MLKQASPISTPTIVVDFCAVLKFKAINDRRHRKKHFPGVRSGHKHQYIIPVFKEFKKKNQVNW